jgi:hypothetical protein
MAEGFCHNLIRQLKVVMEVGEKETDLDVILTVKASDFA